MHDCTTETRKEFVSTAEGPYHFAESGLPNVYLVGVRYFQCECGQKAVEIPAIKQLLALIARDIVVKDQALTGNEIRFLRKSLKQKAVDFSEKLHLKAETLSRVENNKQKISQQTDKFIRLYYALASKDSVLLDMLKEALDKVLAEQRKAPPKKPPVTVAKIEHDEWALAAKA